MTRDEQDNPTLLGIIDFPFLLGFGVEVGYGVLHATLGASMTLGDAIRTLAPEFNLLP